MKYKQIRQITVLLLMAAMGIISCTDKFPDINRNKYEVDKEELGREGYNIGSTLKGMQGLVVPSKEHLYQFIESLTAQPFAGYFGTTLPWTDKTETYNPSVDWQNKTYGDIITETYPLYRDMFDKTEDPVALALAKILKVSIMHRVTDMYGPIPYSNAISETGEVSLTVPYDSQEDAYKQMMKELDESITILTENKNLDPKAFVKYDNVYFGIISKWLKYANSLKLRMAMRMVYADETTAKVKAEEAVASGVITANVDNAQLAVEENRTAMIYNGWCDHRVGADIISYMNGYKDPRREKMFTKGKFMDKEDFYGIRIGINVVSKEAIVDKNAGVDVYSNRIVTDKDPILWMTAAEITFLRAEGALRGWNMGETAKELYNRAITLSFEQHGAAGAAVYAENATDKPIAYVDPLGTHSFASPQSSITVKWEDDAAAFERNLERIITQKWIAIFPLGVEAWSEQRRTGYPKLLPVVENKSGGVIDSEARIRRLWYSPHEYGENRENIEKAVALLGGPDNGATRLWWDKKSK